MTPDQIQGWLQIGLGGLMLAALILGFKRIWVWGWAYAAVEKDRDEWKALALDGLKQNADLISAAKRHTTFTPEEAELALQIVREAGLKRSE